MHKTPSIERYLADFRRLEAGLNGETGTRFHELRKEAIRRFAEAGFPTRKMEEWKYTGIDPILSQPYTDSPTIPSVSEKELAPFRLSGIKQNVLVFLNGRFSVELSTLTAIPRGAVVQDLKTALPLHRELIENHISRYASIQDNSFTALNTALSEDGLFIYLPDNVEFEEPVHLLYLSDPREPFQSHPRILVVTGRNSRLNLAETHYHLTEGAYFYNSVCEILVGENARVEYTQLQDDSTQAFNISTCNVQQLRDSVFTSVGIDLGSALVRNNLNIRLNGENAEANLFGFYLAAHHQHIDNHTFVDHAVPYCNSNELYKGIVTHTARAVFSGTILVREGAQKTNAFQSNKNLLLSNDAEIDTKPQLKIYADDVKCSHGATIGELDETALFYLQQRGISREKASRMLRAAFASEVFRKTGSESVREQMEQLVRLRLKRELGDNQKEK